MQKIKYSILLPVHNGIKYLKECLDSIVSLNFSNFELVISENKSDDGTTDVLKEYERKYDFIRIIYTKELLSQSDNWSNAIESARGEWIMLLGVDDALTPNCFDIAEQLTEKADQLKLNIIKTNRIYYFWDDPKTRELYNNTHFYYFYDKHYTVKKTKEAFYNALYDGYFVDMPQMYTTSMFRKSLVEKIKAIASGKRIVCYDSPDAYLGCAACFCEDKYLYSDMPFAWVGTSSASQGYKDSQEYLVNKKRLSREEYLKFDSKTYKTINSTELLIAGAMNKIQNELCNHIKFKYDCIQVVKNVIYKKQKVIDDYSENLIYLMDAFHISSNDISYHRYYKKSNMFFRFIKYLRKKLKISRTFEASYSDSKTKSWTYSQLNKLI